jgi:hypothetical protein
MYAFVQSVQQYSYDSLRSFHLSCSDANTHEHMKHSILRAATAVMKGCTFVVNEDELPRVNRAALLGLVIYGNE